MINIAFSTSEERKVKSQAAMDIPQHVLGGLFHSRFFRYVLGIYGTQVTVAAVGLITGVAVARVLGPEGRGAYAVAAVISVIGVQLGSLGMQGSNSYFVARDRTMLAPTLVNSLVVSLVVGSAGGAACWLIFRTFPGAVPIDSSLMVLAILGIPIGLAYFFIINLLMALQEVRIFNIIELSNKVLAALFIVGAVASRARTAQAFLLLVLLAQTVCLGLALRILIKFCDSPMTPSVSVFRKNFSIGWKVYLSCVFGFLVVRIDLLMVRSLSGAAPAGYYSIVGSLGDYVLMLPTAVSMLLFPKLSSIHDESEKRTLTLKAVAVTSLALAAVLLLLVVSGKVIIGLLFGKAFLPASTAVFFLAPGILFLGVEVVLVQYLNSCGFPASVVVLWIFSTFLNIGLNWWAIPAYGINGAAAVSSISYLFALGGVAWMTRRKWKSAKSPVMSDDLHDSLQTFAPGQEQE